MPLEFGVDELERALVPATGEVPERIESADAAGQHRGRRRTGQSPFENDDEERVQRHVGHGADDRHNRAELRFFRRHVERLEGHLKHEGRQSERTDTAVDDALVDHFPFGAQHAGQRLHQEEKRHHEKGGQHEGELDQHREHLVCPVVVAFTHCLRDEG